MGSSFAAILLAAGMSRRMGQNKMLLPFGDRTMLARIIENLRSIKKISKIIVVTGHASQEIITLVGEYDHTEIIHNPDYVTGGMLSSVKVGISSLTKDIDAFFLVLGDQPGVSSETLQSLCENWDRSKARIVLPLYEGRRGHPVLLTVCSIPEILALPPEATMKTFISRYSNEVSEVSVDDPSVIADVDTPEDYERALELWNAHQDRI